MNKKNNFLLRYAGLAFQFMLAIGLALFIGIKIDGWMGFSTPLAVWILPLLLIFGVIYSIIKQTSQKK